MWKHSGKVAYAGVGHAEVYRRWNEEAETSLGALAIIAASRAIEDCGLTVDDIDGIFTAPGPLGGEWLPRPIPTSMTNRFLMSNDGMELSLRSSVTKLRVRRCWSMMVSPMRAIPGGQGRALLTLPLRQTLPAHLRDAAHDLPGSVERYQGQAVDPGEVV